MWSAWLVFCDCGFHCVCPLRDKNKSLMKASWWERLIEGETGSCSVGAMLSKSLFFFNFYFCFILLYNTVLVLPYIDMNQPQEYMNSQSWITLPPPTPYHLSGSSLCTGPKHPVSCIEHRLVILSLPDSIHVSMPFFQIIPPSPSTAESKSLFYTSVSLLLSRIEGYHYHLSKFHIYVLVYCIGVFLSGLLHSV